MAQLPTEALKARMEAWPAEVLFFVGYAAPFAIAFIGLLFNGMRNSVFVWPGDNLTSLFAGLFVQTLLAAGWIIFDMKTISSDRITGQHIKQNAAVSAGVASLMALLAGVLSGLGTLPWWLVVPVMAAMIDEQQVIRQGIINALQKPIVQAGPRP